jgi:DNA modification methylase
LNQIIQGDCLHELKKLPEKSIHCCVTSPPYWGLRDYGIPTSEWPEVTYYPMSGTPPLTVPHWTGCLGLEPTPEMFVAHIVLVFREVRRVLRDDGTLWLNFGDTYVSTAPGTMGDNIHIEGTKEATKRARKIERRKIPEGLKTKDLVGIPWRVAFALQADGWYLRMDNIWYKTNPMPESVQDRPTKAHEYVFLLSKSKRYYYDNEAIKEPCVQEEWANGLEECNRPNLRNVKVGGSKGAFGPPQSRTRTGNIERKYGNDRGRPGSQLGANIPWEGTMRNKRSVWTVATTQFHEAHFATFPERLIEPCILAGCPVGGYVLDPFHGSGTTGLVAIKNNRNIIGIEMNPKYIEIEKKRLTDVQPTLCLS